MLYSLLKIYFRSIRPTYSIKYLFAPKYPSLIYHVFGYIVIFYNFFFYIVIFYTCKFERKLTCTVLIYINHNIDLCANAGVFMDSSYLDIYHIECINCSTL